MIEPWKILESESVVDNRWISLYKKKFLLPTGKELPDYYIVKKPDIILIISVTEDKRMMIMKEFERGVLEVGFKFPAGRVNPQESPETAARRELLEETGLSIGKLTQVGILDADPGWLTTKVYVFVAEELNKVAEANLEPSELFESEWLPFAILGELIRKGAVHNIFVVAGYHLAAQYLNFSEKNDDTI